MYLGLGRNDSANTYTKQIRDKYESEKEKLWNFVQVLSTFTHAEKLYLSKPSH